MKYKFTISPEGIKRTLSDMFTSEITFLTEICQNSQRAGATNVDIKYSEESRVLTITDDGHGFTEQGWESFFTVGSSGWGDDVMKEQNPFGIGRVDEWWYLATTDALAKACPNLVEMAIETDCEYDDAGGYFNYLSQLTFRSADSEYRYNFDADGFGADEDLLDENGNFGGEEYKKLEGILGRPTRSRY